MNYMRCMPCMSYNVYCIAYSVYHVHCTLATHIRLSNRAHIWPNLELEGGKPIPSP